MKLRYGTRGSALALAQSGLFADELRRLRPGLELERVVIQTSGDRFSLARPQALPGEEPANVKAMFVKELEEALLCGAIDFAVHSSKDLPGELPPGLLVAAFPRRADPRDVYIGTPAGDLIDGARWTPPADYDPRNRPWYKRAVETGTLSFTTPYVDLVLLGALRFWRFGLLEGLE